MHLDAGHHSDKSCHWSKILSPLGGTTHSAGICFSAMDSSDVWKYWVQDHWKKENNNNDYKLFWHKNMKLIQLHKMFFLECGIDTITRRYRISDLHSCGLHSLSLKGDQLHITDERSFTGETPSPHHDAITVHGPPYVCTHRGGRT